MAKVNIKHVLVDKGEKYLLMGAGGMMLLLAIMGVVQISATPRPEEFVQEVEKNTNAVTSGINAPSNRSVVADLRPETEIKPKIDIVKSTAWKDHLFFDPIAPPDKRKINPIVLGVSEIQADFLWAKIVAYDLREGEDGVPLVGVIKQKAKSDAKSDPEKVKQLASELKSRFGGGGTMVRPKIIPANDGKQAPAPVAQEAETGKREFVDYIPVDSEKMKDYRPALTLYPQRMVVVQASFPYKAQIEEIQKALRLQDPMEVFEVYKPEEVPLFRGIVVQRQILSADGKNVESAWADFDYVGTYAYTIDRRLYQIAKDDAGLQYVSLHPAHRLAMPLPYLMMQKYPELRLPSLAAAIKRLQDLRKPPPVQKAPSQFSGEGNIFDRSNTGSGGAAGQPNIGADGIMPKAGVPDKEDPNAVATFEDKPDQVLVRFIDNDIVPGKLYQYRIKVRMQNPNWVGNKDKKGNVPHKEKYDLVSRPSDADVEMLEGPWVPMETTVSVPREEYLFAADPMPDPKDLKKSQALKNGQGMLQVQRWLPVASVGSYKEPVGDWVIADVVATRGTYLGGKQFVNLPLWASEFNRYILRDAPPEKGKKEPRHGVTMDPTRPGPVYVVAEIDGGPRDMKTAGRTISEETAAEVLLIDENGGLQVRSSYADRSDSGRAEREKTWREWIKRTEEDTKSLIPDGEKGPKKGGFFGD